jgi:hypothetical protein
MPGPSAERMRGTIAWMSPPRTDIVRMLQSLLCLMRFASRRERTKRPDGSSRPRGAIQPSYAAIALVSLVSVLRVKNREPVLVLLAAVPGLALYR